MKDDLTKGQKMMLGIAIGDAFGAGYEFAYEDIDKYHKVDMSKYLRHPNLYIPHKPGMYTDDTQMSIAVAELLADKSVFNKQNLAEYIVKAHKRDPVFGYAKSLQKFLNEVENGQEFLDNIKPHSTRNGAAVRSVPIGVNPDCSSVEDLAEINAALTHNTPKGRASSVAVALMSYYKFTGQIYHPTREIFWKVDIINTVSSIDTETADYLSQVFEMRGLDRKLLLGADNQNKGVPCDGMRTAGAVLYIISNYTDPKEVLRESVRLGGDTDSVASIAMGLTMMNNSVDAIPPEMYEGLTNHKYGRDFLLDLGKRLE